jgi:hypothetical protein
MAVMRWTSGVHLPPAFDVVPSAPSMLRILPEENSRGLERPDPGTSSKNQPDLAAFKKLCEAEW